MQIVKTQIEGLLKLIPFSAKDNRGLFVKTMHRSTLESHGLHSQFSEEFYSISESNVLRGMHFQVPPREHVKIVSCLQGSILDVVLDMRVGSPTYGKAASFELSGKQPEMIYIPAGLAHGFLVIQGPALVYYMTSTEHAPKCDAGVLWNSFGFNWPVESPIMSERDQNFVGFSSFKSPFVFDASKR